MDLDIPSLSTATFYAPGMECLVYTQEEMGISGWNCHSCAGGGGDRSATETKNRMLKWNLYLQSLMHGGATAKGGSSVWKLFLGLGT